MKNAPSFNAWVDQVRERMSARTLSDLFTGAAQAREAGDLAQAERLSLEYLNRDGLYEKMVMFLMKLYQQDGRYYKAANLYQKLKDRLAEELGIAPLHETAALYYDIVNQWNQATAEDAVGAAHADGKPGPSAAKKIQDRYQAFKTSNQTPSLWFTANPLRQSYLAALSPGRRLFGHAGAAGLCSQMQVGVY